MRIILFCLFYLGINTCVTAQFLARKNCLHPTIIKLKPTGNEVLSETGIQEFDDREHVIVNYYTDDNVSKWYELIVEYDITLSFKIWSANSASKYGFFIYKKDESSFFCEDLSRGKEEPIETVIFKENIGILGIGILPTVNASLNDTTKYDDSDLLYRVPYKNAIQASAGDTFYLNVYRYAMDDCGHYLWLTANGNTTKINCVNELCERTKVVKRITVEKYIDSTEIKLIHSIAEAKRPKPFIRSITILDSLSNVPISASLFYGTDSLYAHEIYKLDSTRNHLITLYSDTSFIVNKVGYHSKLIHLAKNQFNYQDVRLKKIEPGEQFILENIYFQTNSSRILTHSKPELEKLAEFLRENRKYKIEIQGHTNGESKIKKDRRYKDRFHGDEKKLSRLRAQSVKRVLVDMGISNNRLKTKGLGGEKMLFPFPKTAAEHNRNKRVEIMIL